MNHEEIENLNSAIISKDVESVIQNLSKNKNPRPDSFTGKFYPTFKQIPILLKLIQKIEEKGTLPNSFYEANITLISKPKILHRKKITGQYHR